MSLHIFLRSENVVATLKIKIFEFFSKDADFAGNSDLDGDGINEIIGASEPDIKNIKNHIIKNNILDDGAYEPIKPKKIINSIIFYKKPIFLTLNKFQL